MRLDGFGLMVKNMSEMIRFYRDVLGFEIKEKEDATHVYLIKDNTLFMLYGREDFEKMTGKRYEYIGKGLNGHFEIAFNLCPAPERRKIARKAQYCAWTNARIRQDLR